MYACARDNENVEHPRGPSRCGVRRSATHHGLASIQRNLHELATEDSARISRNNSGALTLR